MGLLVTASAPMMICKLSKILAGTNLNVDVTSTLKNQVKFTLSRRAHSSYVDILKLCIVVPEMECLVVASTCGYAILFRLVSISDSGNAGGLMFIPALECVFPMALSSRPASEILGTAYHMKNDAAHVLISSKSGTIQSFFIRKATHQ